MSDFGGIGAGGANGEGTVGGMISDRRGPYTAQVIYSLVRFGVCSIDVLFVLSLSKLLPLVYSRRCSIY